MRLTALQREQFERDGYLFFPSMFMPDETATMTHAVPELYAHREFTLIECLPDDCLLKDYPVDLPWKDGVPASALVTSPEPLLMAAE